MSSEELPDFERPPVVETVLGVQFEPLREFRNAHLGIFWKFLRSEKVRAQLGFDWPRLIDAPRLEPVTERFAGGEAWARLGLQLKISQDPSARLQIQNTDRDRMIQLQNGQLHYNWLGHGGRDYPRYSRIRPEFNKVLDQFQLFVVNEQLGEMQPNQWEITYVNHLPKGTVWNDPKDWKDIFRDVPGTRDYPGSVRLESFASEWHLEIQPQLGRLHIQLAHGRSDIGDGGGLLRLTLTARGPIGKHQDGDVDLDKGLELGRKTIVTTFKAITSDSAHKYWGLKS